MAENREELKSHLMKVKEVSEKAGVKLNIPQIKIMASSPITSCQIDGEAIETVILYFLGLQQPCGWWMLPLSWKTLAPRKKSMTNLNSVIISRDITLVKMVQLVKATVFPVVTYGCESWTIKKAQCWRIDAFELWCWRRLLRVPWTARRSNQSTPKEIRCENTLEILVLKLKLQYFGHLMWITDSFEKTLMLEEKGTTGDEASTTRGTWV